MSIGLRFLRLDAGRWDDVDDFSLWSGAAIAVVTGFLIALIRFGGLSVTEPRSFLRLALVGVWGWIWLATAIWLAGSLAVRLCPTQSGQPDGPHRSSIRRSFAAAGLAHVPLLSFAGVVFFTAMLMQLVGPGRAAAVFVFAVWFPASLAVAVRALFRVDLPIALAITFLPYAAWCAVVGRHLHRQIGHLL